MNNDSNILFIINPSNCGQAMWATGILCLSSYLEKEGFSNLIIDSKICSKISHNLNDRIQSVVHYVKTLQPKIIGFSATHRETMEVIKINKIIKELLPGLYTIVGGSQPTYRANDFLSNGFDFVGVGEGEKILTNFVREIIQKTYNFSQIDGLVWKNDDKIVYNKPQTLLSEKELSDTPMPSYNKIDQRYFNYNVEVIRGLPLRSGLILTTRGCPFSCTFCGCNLIFGKKLRFRDVNSVEKDIEYLYSQKKIEGIWIVDDTFTVNKYHATKIARLLHSKNLLWGCQSRVDVVNDDLLKIFKDCGCVQLDFGVESGSPRILTDIIKKGTNPDQIRKAFSLTKKYKIRTLANIMIGLPTETIEDLQLTKKIINDIKPDVTVVSIATPLPGTKLYELVGEEIEPKQYSLLNWNGSDLTKQLNKSEITDVVNVRRAMQKKYLIRALYKALFHWEGIKFFFTKKDKYNRLKIICKFLLKEFKK